MTNATPLLHRRWFQNSLLGVVGVVFVFGFVRFDVVQRARHAYQEAEKYMAWHANPELKKQALQLDFDNKKKKLDQKKEKRKISDIAYQQQLESLEFDHQFQFEESSLKYAYQWYKDTYELFSPPESTWVKMARQKAPQTLELWKQELREKKIPFEETMVE